MAKNKLTGLDYEKIEKDVNKLKDTLKNRSVSTASSDHDEGTCELVEQAHLAVEMSIDQVLLNLELCRNICEHCQHEH